MGRPWLLWGLLAAAAAGVAALLLAVRPVTIPFLLAVALAYLLAPAVGALEARGLSRPLAILAVYLGLGLAAAALILQVLPGALREWQRLARDLPAYGAQARAALDALQARFRDAGLPQGLRAGLDQTLARLQQRADGLMATAVGNLLLYLEWLGYLALAPILAFYLLRDLEAFKAAFARLLPDRWRGPVLGLLRDIDGVLAGFVRGQVLLAAAVGTLAGLACHLLGLRFAFLLGLWAALTEMIPYVGPLLGAVPAVVVALAQSPVRALQVAAAFALIQQLENAVLGPRLLGAHVGLHPLVVLLAVLAGGYLFGVPGLVLAVPAAGVARVVGRFAYRYLLLPGLQPRQQEAADPAAKVRGEVAALARGTGDSDPADVQALCPGPGGQGPH